MKKNNIIRVFFFILMIGLSNNLSSQIRKSDFIDIGDFKTVTISGSKTVNVNDVRTYTASASGVTIYSGKWSVFGGSVLSQNATSATIKWNSSGKKVINYTATKTNKGVLEGVYSVTVNNIDAPSIPSIPSIASQNCSNANLQRGNPPSGITWYWQGTNPAGTSTSNSNSTYLVSNSGRYYLRARNGSGIWSAGSSSVYITLGTVGGMLWYADNDGDGLGDPNTSITQCSQPSGYVSNNSDQCPNTHGGGTPDGCPLAGGLSNENYIYTILPQKAISSISELTHNKDAIKTVVYYDGLGRAKQNIGIKQSATEKDVVTHIEYDDFGRQVKEYLPYASTSGNGYLKINALTETNNYYKTHYASDINATNPNPFSEKEFDNSPLNRVMKQSAPGHDWRLGGGHEIEFDYKTNTASEVRVYGVTLNSSYTPTLTGGTSYYPAGELSKTVTKDENHTGSNKEYTIEEFKNKQGQTILKRIYITNTETADTYFVYDVYGNLTYVLPPKSEAHSAKPDATELSELCYQYKYDHRNRLVEKKIAGKGWEYIIYDKLDRPVLTQDAVQRNQKKWLFTKFDVLGRIAYTGIYTHNSILSQKQMQDYFDIAPTQTGTKKLYESRNSSEFGSSYVYHHYTNYQFPFHNIEILTVNYYDDYNFNRAGTGISVSNVYGVNSTTSLKSLATGSKIKVLGTSKWITTVTYYDDKARPIYTYSKNDYLLSTDIIKTQLDFGGKVTETTSTHTKTDDNLPTITIVDKFEYDHVGRLKKQIQKIGSQAEEVIAYNSYDELGQLKNKGVGGKTTQSRLQIVDYDYNIRGWLKQINNTANLGSDLFAFKLNYNTTNHSGTELYNGNIAETEWRTKNDNTLRWYRYSYDPLNRIKSATDNSNRYSLSSVNYDKNGNITRLQRRGHRNSNATSFGLMDNLQYTYASRSNKLTRVQELSGGHSSYGFKNGSNNTIEYTYDANGNMLRDYNKNMTSNILYNHLNLPTRVTIEGKHIYYTYDAIGTKLRKKVNGITTDYAGNYIYEKNGSGVKTLQFFSQSEGYVKNDNGIFSYIYQYKDHLGNIRLSYTDADNNGSVTQNEIIEESNYYPFGLKHKGYNNVVSSNGNSTAQKFGYNNKELEESLGLNWLEYGARNYDASLGRFFNIDRYSESFMPISTYQYGANNPILYLDYNGDYITIGINDDDGNQIYSVLYENGKAYHYTKDKDGNIVKGDEYDGDSSFVDSAISDLNKISDTKQGRRIVGKLQQSSDGYNIVNSGNAISPTFNPVDNTIAYNPDKSYGFHDGVSFDKSFINLGHELGHAYDKDRGFDMNSFIGDLPASEINAVRFENYLRAHDGQSKMRLQYTTSKTIHNLRSHFGGSSVEFFKSFISPLGRNEVRRLLVPVRDRSRDLRQRDNTYVRPVEKTGVFDTKQQKFVSFE